MINGKDTSMKKIPFTQSIIVSGDEQIALARRVARGFIVEEQRNDALATLERVSILADHITTALNVAIEAMQQSDQDFTDELELMHETLACGHQAAYPGEPVPGE